jgi:hypothetical protein
VFCESAQKDCPYLDYVDELTGLSITFRAVEEVGTEDAESIEREAAEVMEATKLPGVCGANRCALIGMAIANAVLYRATHNK